MGINFFNAWREGNNCTITRDAKGFDENQKAAQRGGQIAHNARKELEQETGKSIENFA